MDKRIKMTDGEIRNYFIREQKVMEYGFEFFKDLCACSITPKTCQMVRTEVLPLSCYNLMDEILYAIDTESNSVIHGGFVYAGDKQAYIRIGIDTNNSILNKNLKQMVRHEIIHYYLWVVDLPFNDDDLEFWCLCHVYDAGAYEKLSPENQEYYELFVKLYDSYADDLPLNARHAMVGHMMAGIEKNSIEEYSDYVESGIKIIKQIFHVN